jgi:hypothetical protein
MEGDGKVMEDGEVMGKSEAMEDGEHGKDGSRGWKPRMEADGDETAMKPVGSTVLYSKTD